MTPLELLTDLRQTAAYHPTNPSMARVIAACDYCDLPGALAAAKWALAAPNIQRMPHLQRALGEWLYKAQARLEARIAA
jgi:hypothetical protein